MSATVIPDAPLVLVADDEHTTTAMLQHILSRAGYRVGIVHDGRAALDAVAQMQPDILLLDILMPEMNGFETLRHLRENPDTQHLPTIFITANAREPADIARGLRLGADDYIQKPFAPQELLARIESKLRSSRLERALQQRSAELEALLHMSETLNAHLTEAELLDVTISLIAELVPGLLVSVIRLSERGRFAHSRGAAAHEPLLDALRGANNVLDMLGIESPVAQAWAEGEPSPLANVPSGLIVPLEHRGEVLGLLLVTGEVAAFSADQQRLLEGAARQVALALVNAHLYGRLSDYAQNLETMVEARTNELQSAQQLLVRSEKLASIGHLAASIAHEINNPLMPIRNLLEDIILDLDQQQVQYDRRAVTIIEESLERIRGIVSRMLEFSRDSKPTMGWTDVSDVLDAVITLNRKSFEHDRITVEADLQPMPEVYASPDQLQQVFMNIALNAHAAMSAGGKFTVRTRAEPDWVVVEMIDTGCGIPQDQLDQIFHPFFSTKPTGTGLGLFVSHNIIEAHQGAIDVTSAAGKGTTFSIRLPRSIEPSRN